MLRLKLILWYSLLVVLTVTGIGLVQTLILQRSMIQGLDNSLIEDARVTLSLINNLPISADTEQTLQHASMRSGGSLRDLVDRVITEEPDTVAGQALTDRVMSHLVDEILTELSYEDSTGNDIDPLDAIAQRNISSRRNNFVEIHLRRKHSKRLGKGPVLFRTKNLGRDTLSSIFATSDINEPDSAVVIGQEKLHGEPIRVARTANNRFVVYVGFPSTEVEDSITRLRSSFLYLLPLALCFSTIGGLWLARKALSPMERIADTASEIGAKNLSQRIALPVRTDRELRVLTNTLNSMFARLESSFNQVAQFTSDASHELKTPLAIMKGEIEQASRHLEQGHILDPNESREVLESLMEEVERMQRIVEGLLLLSQADDRRLVLHKEPIVLYEFLDSLAEDGAILAHERGLELIRDLDQDARSASVMIDPTRLYQVIMNLLDNALKYTLKGSVTMFLHSGTDKGSLQFGIADTGIGISADDLPKVFQRFYRTDEARTGPHEMGDRSLGLGLAIVRSIVEAHDGTITVESEHGKGTRFTITLPLSAQTHPADGRGARLRTITAH